MSQRAIVLVDLDDTLITRDSNPLLQLDDVISYKSSISVDVFDMLRPDAIMFLQRIAARAHVALCTNKPHPFSDIVHKYLRDRVPEMVDIHDHELNRMRCSDEEWICKHLNAIFCDVQDARRCILIDDDVEYIYKNIGHSIPAVDFSNFVNDWNHGLLRRILPVIESALDAHDQQEQEHKQQEQEQTQQEQEHKQQEQEHKQQEQEREQEQPERAGDLKRARARECVQADSDPIKSRAVLSCATHEHRTFGVSCYCGGDVSREQRARVVFSGDPVCNARTGARLHARIRSTHACFDMSDIGHDDPIARTLIARAYGNDFVQHWTRYKEARVERDARRAVVRAVHDALPDHSQRRHFRLTDPSYRIMHDDRVSYMVGEDTFSSDLMPACMSKFNVYAVKRS